jgi:hypothetical protein
MSKHGRTIHRSAAYAFGLTRAGGAGTLRAVTPACQTDFVCENGSSLRAPIRFGQQLK